MKNTAKFMLKARRCVALIGIIGSTGCFSPGAQHGSIVAPAQKKAIVPGTTTKTEILRELGNPDQKIDLGNKQEQFSYITLNIRRGMFIPMGGGVNGLGGISSNTEYWILFENDIVKETGERPTTKSPSMAK
jgi:hypothetical protein